MLVTAVAVDLAANFTTAPCSTVDIDVRRTSANCSDQFVNFAGVNPLRSSSYCGWDVWTHIGRYNLSGNRSRRRLARLSPSWAISKICTQEHRDSTIDALISNTD